MPTFTIWTAGPLIARDFPDMDAAKAYVERHAPLKRGWTGVWVPGQHRDGTPNPRAWMYERRNSKGRHLPTFDVMVSTGRHWRAVDPADGPLRVDIEGSVRSAAAKGATVPQLAHRFAATHDQIERILGR